MKNIVSIKHILLFAFLCSCMLTFAQEGFKLKGEIKGYGNGVIIINHNHPKISTRDTIKIINDIFEYNGSVQSPLLVFFRVMGNEVLDRPYVQGHFMIENSEMQFNAEVDKINGFILSGSPSNDALNLLYSDPNEIISQYSKARSDYRQAVQNKQEVDKSQEILTEKTDNFIKYLLDADQYETNHAVAYIIFNNFGYIPRSQVKGMLSKFSDPVEDNVYLQYMRNRIESEEGISIGGPAPDFKMYDVEDKLYTLKNFKGKHLLLVFSASWCTWCKKELPYLKKAYENYNLDQLNILTINLDTKKELWLEAIKTDAVPWTIVSDLKAFQSPIAKDYAIFAIPRIFLISPDGIIIAMNLRGDTILEELSKAITVLAPLEEPGEK